ncbi:hypothetical protein [Actinomadura litoris]|uniref:Uncharacterized protein n=1 Tax=Actinomadura litoris TaxID=2678616 RepID=A0A7K1LAQ1_9ACTN|nr:hypothetical protein [Actinomadura litoris]MUN41393.1 hypothetical protein [Actinomadura litoris]
MSVSGTLAQGAIAAGIAGVPALVAGWFAFRQATRVQKHADRAALTDDLQEEVADLRKAVSEARKETDELRFRLRGAMDYLQLCMTVMRRNGVDPPPVPDLVKFPWEESR